MRRVRAQTAFATHRSLGAGARALASREMADPYSVLGVRRDAPDAEVRTAYRRQVKLHHPDHNNGSPESARRFEAVQDAYAEIQRRRGAPGTGDAPRREPAREPTGAESGASAATGGRAAARSGRHDAPDAPEVRPRIEDRLAALEHQVQQARRARDRAQEAAREAARAAREAAESIRAAAAPEASGDEGRPSDEDLGYIKTDDTLGKILSDARSQLSDPTARRASTRWPSGSATSSTGSRS